MLKYVICDTTEIKFVFWNAKKNIADTVKNISSAKQFERSDARLFLDKKMDNLLRTDDYKILPINSKKQAEVISNTVIENDDSGTKEFVKKENDPQQNFNDCMLNVIEKISDMDLEECDDSILDICPDDILKSLNVSTEQLKNKKKVLNNNLKIVSKIITDLFHLSEVRYGKFSASAGFLMNKKLGESLSIRREIKDEIYKIEVIEDIMSKISSEKLDKLDNYLNNRTYRPRILESIFETGNLNFEIEDFLQ